MASNTTTTKEIVVPEGKLMGEEIINLDEEPRNRWTAIGKKYKSEIQAVLAIVKKDIPKWGVRFIDLLGPLLDSLLPAPYAEELRGLAEAAEVLVGELFFMNLAYDISAHCTGIVAQGSDGKILQARNLDVPEELLPFMELTFKSTFVGNFQRGGKTAYKGVIHAGVIGTATGEKPYSFTINLNERRTGSIWDHFLQRDLKHPGSGVLFLIRDALADPDINYQGVLNRMVYIPMISSSYIIIAGTEPGEGAVITRDRKEAVKPFSNGVWRLDSLLGRWYLLQTNNDHWTKPPNLEPKSPGDTLKINTYERFLVGNKEMEKMGQANLSPQGLVDVLSTPPVYNDHTIYTTVMSAADPPLNQTWIRNVKK